MVGDERISRTQKVGQKLTHLSLITGSGLTDEDIGRFADSQRNDRRIPKSLARIGCKELLTRNFGKKHKTGVVAAFLAYDLGGILHAKERILRPI